MSDLINNYSRKRYTESRYNYMCRNNAGSNYLMYNFLTGAMLEIDEATKKRLGNLNNITDEELAILLDNGFLVQDFDELLYLKYGNKLVCCDEELLSVLIAPTMECNFDCPYCFEHHGNGAMTHEVQDEIIRFIENSIISHNHKHLFVYWFGGEPLLYIDIIKKMSERILSLVKDYNLTYSSAMSTNGYLLTEKNVSILEQCKLNRIQITLDGVGKANDETRKLTNGGGTFDVIISNIKALKTPIQIHIRSNLNKENASEYAKLSDLIDEIKNTTGIDISLYGAHMSVYDYNNENVDGMELSMREYSDILKKNNLIGANKKSSCRFAFCDAAKTYSFCFDEKGNMYKCWNDIGTTKYSYDNVFSANENGIKLTNNNALYYLSKSFPDECSDCKILPLCMGGCIKKRVIEEKKSCSPVKYNMDDYVNKRYQLTKGGKINETGN